MKRHFRAYRLLVPAIFCLLGPLADAGGRDSGHWSISVGVGSSPHWRLGHHDFHRPFHRGHFDRWGWDNHDFHHPFHRDPFDRWHLGYHDFHDPFHRWHHEPWHHDSWVSWSWRSPFIRNSDPWTERAVPYRTVVLEPTATERALEAFDNPSSSVTKQEKPEEQASETETTVPDGAALAGEGLAALAREDYSAAIELLRRAFAEDPASAALTAADNEFRETCNALKNALLYRHPHMLTTADAQFLRAVLFLYTGDLPSAAHAASTIRDGLASTARLQDATGSS